MKQNQVPEELMELCVQYFDQQAYSVPSIDTYKFLWKKKLLPYMAKHSILYYDASVGEEYLRHRITGKSISSYERLIIRSIRVLSEFQDKGTVCKRYCQQPKREFSGAIGVLMEKFFLHLKSLRRSSTTIQSHQQLLYNFLTYLGSKQIQNIEDISTDHIIIFLSTSTNNRICMVSSIRTFFGYLYEEKVLKSDLSSSFKNFKWSRGEKLPSVYSKSEVLQIEHSIQRSSPKGKRNYSMMLLASRLGLRASDIAQLSFHNIDWDQSTITLFQFKTGNEIKLPLLAEVGEALIDYLKYGRKHSESEKVFLYTRAPYSSMRDKAVSSAIAKTIQTSGVSTIDRKRGSHVMRHSLVSRFLENKTSMPVISEALGHQRTDTTMSYLRIDITSLRQCALEVPMIPDLFYEQKGGVFYG